MSELSLNEKQRIVSDAIRTAWGGDGYVAEFYDDRAIWEQFAVPGNEGGLWQVPYTIDEQDKVTLGERVAVQRKTSYAAVKRVAPDVIEGIAIPFGGLKGGRDFDDERFTADTDLCIDWFGPSGRPLLYHHGMDAAVKASVTGRQVEFEVRDDGVWAQSQLDKHHRYRRAIDQLIEEEALGYSSGAMPHLATKSRDGTITRWPWVELSLTPTPAAGPLSAVHYVKSADVIEHFAEAGTEIPLAALKALAAWADQRDAAPDPESLDEKAGRVSAAIDVFRDHARSAAQMRAKAGRVLSGANRDRIAKALASRDAVLAAYADLEALLAETDPETATKAAAALADEALAFERLQARMRGVAVG